MGKVIVVEFVTLDGIVEDPDGSGGMDGGGWAFQAGPDVFAGDKFALGPIMSTGVLLLGRSTWEMFAGRWPTRTGAFADAMNAATKVVVSSRALALDAWSNSVTLEGDLVEGVRRLAADRDVAVIGSMSVAHQLAAADVVDEYRLLTIPIAVGRGTPLFTSPLALQLASIESTGAAGLAYYERVRESVAAGT
jgi:dihydrofolate reductase